MNRGKAKLLRTVIEQAVKSLDDSTALTAVELYPLWSSGAEYDVGIRVRYDGVLYRCLQSHTSQETWVPTDAPSLFARVLIPDEDTIPEWEQPDSTNPYMKGDKVTYNGKTYVSTIDNNVWVPDAYPAGWELISE